MENQVGMRGTWRLAIQWSQGLCLGQGVKSCTIPGGLVPGNDVEISAGFVRVPGTLRTHGRARAADLAEAAVRAAGLAG